MRDDTGHRTATIARPRPPAESRRSTSSRSSRRSSSPITPRSDDGRLIGRRRSRVALALLAAVVAGSLAASVLILPVKAWLNQREELSNREQELSRLDEANDLLAEDVARLETEQGVIEAAREELGAVREDEKVFKVVMDPELVSVMPDGWLFPTIGALITGRGGTIGSDGALTPEPAATLEPETTGP